MVSSGQVKVITSSEHSSLSTCALGGSGHNAGRGSRRRGRRPTCGCGRVRLPAAAGGRRQAIGFESGFPAVVEADRPLPPLSLLPTIHHSLRTHACPCMDVASLISARSNLICTRGAQADQDTNHIRVADESALMEASSRSEPPCSRCSRGTLMPERMGRSCTRWARAKDAACSPSTPSPESSRPPPRWTGRHRR